MFCEAGFDFAEVGTLNGRHVPHDVGVAAAALQAEQRILFQLGFKVGIAACHEFQRNFAFVRQGNDEGKAYGALLAEAEDAAHAFRLDVEIFLAVMDLIQQVQREISAVFIEDGRGNDGVLLAYARKRGEAAVFCRTEEHFFGLEALLVQLFGKSQTPVFKRLQAF